MTEQAQSPAIGFPASNQVFDVRSHNLVVVDTPHPWVLANRIAIENNWLQELAENSALYDGRMVLQHRLQLIDGHLEGLAHMAPFSAFLHWRRTGRVDGPVHLFAMPLVVSADGALVAIQMGRKTANPGRVYGAAGSLDHHDVVGGRCDLQSNMARELFEETSLRLEEARAEPGFKAVFINNTVSVFQVFRYDQDAEALAERIKIHVRSDPDPEIEGPVIIRDSNPDRHDYAYFMPPILNWLFG